jgi:hypothetical protein
MHLYQDLGSTVYIHLCNWKALTSWDLNDPWPHEELAGWQQEPCQVLHYSFVEMENM